MEKSQSPEILTEYRGDIERTVGDKNSSGFTCALGFAARSDATCTWYLKRDSGGTENLNLHDDWWVRPGAYDSAPSINNNSHACGKEGDGFTMDDNGTLQLHIVTESHGEVWSDHIRLTVVEAP